MNMMTDASMTDANSSSNTDEKAKRIKKIDKEERRLIDMRKGIQDEYSRLTNRFERALIEHKLAVEYFEFRSFWFDFLPVTIIAALVTVIGFFISGNTPEMNDGINQANSIEFDPVLTGQSREFWSVAVGVLGVVSTLLNSIGKRTNYQSQYDIHRAAVKALEKICLTVQFEKDWFGRSCQSQGVFETAKKIVDNPDRKAEHEQLENMLGADLKSHQASFKAMQDASCESPVPTRVIQAFTVLDQVATGGTGNATQTDLILYYHKLWKEFSTYQLWPLKSPRIDVREIYKKWQKETQGRSDGSKKEGETSSRDNAASGNRTSLNVVSEKTQLLPK